MKNIVLLIGILFLAKNVSTQVYDIDSDSIVRFIPDLKRGMGFYFFKEEILEDSMFSGIVDKGRLMEKIDFWDSLDKQFKNVEESLQITVEYKNGIKTKSIGYFSDGQLYCISEFNEKGLNGISSIWYKNGQRRALSYYQDGKCYGPSLSWHYNGELAHFGEVVNYNQKFTEWYDNASLYKKTTPTDTGVVNLKYYKNGIIMEEFVGQYGVKKYRFYYDNGKVYIEGKIDGVILFKVGKWEYWYKNSIKEKEILYHDTIPNYPIGSWKYWDEKGNLVKEEIYEGGELKDTKTYLPKEKKR